MCVFFFFSGRRHSKLGSDGNDDPLHAARALSIVTKQSPAASSTCHGRSSLAPDRTWKVGIALIESQ